MPRRKLDEEGVKVVGVPKTIDNDLGATDYTFGFDTAVNIAMEAIDRLHTTAESHQRALIVRGDGPARRLDRLPRGARRRGQRDPDPRGGVRPRTASASTSSRRFESQYSPIVVVAEGAEPKGGMPETRRDAPTDEFGHVRLGGIAHWLEGEIEQRTGHEARATVLGHVQRGGTPTAFDRVLATRFGLHAIDAARRWQLGQDDRPARHRHRAGRS